VQQARDVGRVQKRTLPAGAIFERDAAQVQARDRACGEHRGTEVHQPRRTLLPQRCDEGGPVGDKARDRRGERRRHRFLRQRSDVAKPRRDRTPQRSRRRACSTGRPRARVITRLRRAPCRRDEKRDIDADVPREQREHRWCEQVDAMRRADVDARDADDERARCAERREPAARPCMPRDRTQSGMARENAFDHQRRARADERVVGRAFADARRRRAARPHAIGVAPRLPPLVGRLDRPREDGVPRRVLVHARDIAIARERRV
jgi:hypothetical protein